MHLYVLIWLIQDHTDHHVILNSITWVCMNFHHIFRSIGVHEELTDKSFINYTFKDFLILREWHFSYVRNPLMQGIRELPDPLI
jgi:hypothetical protein